MRRLAGRSAGLGIVGLVPLFTFFAVGGPFGTANGLVAIPGFLSLFPVGLALHGIGRSGRSIASHLGLAVLLAGVAGGVSLQVALVAGCCRCASSPSSSRPAPSSASGTPPPRISPAARSPAGSDAFSRLHPLVGLGFGLAILAYPVSPAWTWWIGRVLLSDPRTLPTGRTA